MKWYIGCSGFYYKEWKGLFYPKGLAAREWFTYYCDYFSTLELNNTFYRFPELPSLENWYTRSPDNFCFSVKAPRVITHYKQFHDILPLLNEFYAVIRKGLSDKLGPVLFQMPPAYAYTPERLQQILQAIDPSFDNVLEFRHQSWWRQEVTGLLAEKNAAFCGISYPGLPEEVIIHPPLVYYRFHGQPRLYFSPYNAPCLEAVANTICRHPSPSIEKTFLYFNNTAAGSAIENALYLKGYTATAGIHG